MIFFQRIIQNSYLSRSFNKICTRCPTLLAGEFLCGHAIDKQIENKTTSTFLRDPLVHLFFIEYKITEETDQAQ